MLYFPPASFHKPYPLIIYFHGFPQLFALKEIVKDHQYLLDMGYSFLVSISSQVSDSIKIIEFVRKMAERNVFNLNSVNLIAYDFGAYIALILSSKIKVLNRMLLISPIINLEKHANHIDFSKSLRYINQFLPGNVKGIENVDVFIKKTKNELKNKSYQIKEVLKQLKCKTLRIIIGDSDKITPVNEITEIVKSSINNLDLVIIDNMDHEIIQEEEVEKIHEEINNFFKF
jgi:esterase/lipase